MQGNDPMILTLARGHYCPKEHQQGTELLQGVVLVGRDRRDLGEATAIFG